MYYIILNFFFSDYSSKTCLIAFEIMILPGKWKNTNATIHEPLSVFECHTRHRDNSHGFTTTTRPTKCIINPISKDKLRLRFRHSIHITI